MPIDSLDFDKYDASDVNPFVFMVQSGPTQSGRSGRWIPFHTLYIVPSRSDGTSCVGTLHLYTVQLTFGLNFWYYIYALLLGIYALKQKRQP